MKMTFFRNSESDCPQYHNVVHLCTAFVGIVTQKAKTNLYHCEITKHPVATLHSETDFSKILTLSLFVSRIFTDYSYSSFSFDDFAFFANRFY